MGVFLIHNDVKVNAAVNIPTTKNVCAFGLKLQNPHDVTKLFVDLLFDAVGLLESIKNNLDRRLLLSKNDCLIHDVINGNFRDRIHCHLTILHNEFCVVPNCAVKVNVLTVKATCFYGNCTIVRGWNHERLECFEMFFLLLCPL